MKANVKKIQKHRRYSEEFKKSITTHFETGKFSVLELSRLHNLHPKVIYRWIYQYSSLNEQGYRIVEISESSENKVKQLKEKIKELERLVGQKQIKIDYLEKMIDVAKSDMHIDIKKNYSSKRSNGSGQGKKK